MMADEQQIREIDEEEDSSPLLQKNYVSESGMIDRSAQTVRTKVPEAEVHVYKQGKGPIDVLKVALAGWDQDQLDIGEILLNYGLKSVYAFAPGSGRGAPIRFNQRNGLSLLTYRDGSVVYLDGEPKDSLLQPITKILVGVTVITSIIILLVKDTPDWVKRLNMSSSSGISPWIFACAVIVFTRIRKRTRNFLERYIH